MNRTLNKSDYEKLSDDELEIVYLQIKSNLANIRMQLDHAKANQKIDGEFADATWFVKANASLRFQGIADQTVARIIGERNRKKREENGQNTEKNFIAIARRVLSQEQFMDILNEAKS